MLHSKYRDSDKTTEIGHDVIVSVLQLTINYCFHIHERSLEISWG